MNEVINLFEAKKSNLKKLWMVDELKRQIEVKIMILL